MPSPYRAFEAQGALFRRGGMAMIAGPPGSLKTMATLNIVRKIELPTMYFCNDSDSYTMVSRSLAMLSGRPTSETESWSQTHTEYAQNLLKKMGHVRWSFDPSPDLDHMEKEMDAYAEILGRYPDHTVIDILMNVDYEGVEQQNYWGLMAELHELSRRWSTALTIVHHSSEAVKGEPCPPRHAIMGKANHLPVLIMTVNPTPTTLQFAVVKNRFGQSDPTGRTFFELPAQPWCSRIDELEEE